MKKIFIFSLALCCLICAGCSNSGSAVDMTPRELSSSGDSISMLSEARSAVVGISVEYDDGYSIGSGVAVIDGSMILTNNHVVEGGGDITLYFADETTGSATVLWRNSGLDLAVLKSDKKIPYLAAGQTSQLDVGEDVYAVGTPLTLQFKHTVTKGIVSAKDRTLQVDSSAGLTFYQSLIQHDASINPGNSGGPLIDSNGHVVGINTLKATEGEGLGFAIPIEVGMAIAERLYADNSYVAPYLGVFGFDSEIARVYGVVLQSKGVYVVSTDGPALNADIQKGDLITKIGDYDINSMLDLRVAMFKFDAGQTVTIQFVRNGIIKSVDVQLR